MSQTSGDWVGSWAVSPHGPFVIGPLLGSRMHSLHTNECLGNVTVRQIVHLSLGGQELRVRFSHSPCQTPLTIGAAYIGISRSGAGVEKGSNRPITFNGCPSVSIPPGAGVVSDPVKLVVKPFSDLAVSIYLPGNPADTGLTLHFASLQENYFVRAGNYADLCDLPEASTFSSYVSLVGVDVKAPAEAAAVVVIGDCTADGEKSSMNANKRWVNVLAARLYAAGESVSVLGAGIIGNRLLRDGPGAFLSMFGASALSRFQRDVLDQPGVQYVITSIGGGDILHPGATAPPSEEVGSAEIIDGLRDLVSRARTKNLRIFGSTLTPFENGFEPRVPNYYSPEKERKRQEVNCWIRESGNFDGVLDFDQIVRDPIRPSRLCQLYDAGDHFHLNDLGHQAIGNAIDLTVFNAASRTKHPISAEPK